MTSFARRSTPLEQTTTPDAPAGPVRGATDGERAGARVALLADAGWADAAAAPLAGDASTRRYERLRKPDGATAVLMDAPPGAESAACPWNADAPERIRLGYNASARLAGPNAAAFAGLAQELTARGLSAPRVIASDLDHGFLLLEDLGDALFARAIGEGAAPAPLYEAAVDALAAMRRATLPTRVGINGAAWPILTYDALALQTEADLLVDWYAPHHAGAVVDASAREAWRAAWAPLLAEVAGDAATLVLRDVHAENLIWLPEREGPARAGLLDFQDALFGHPAYDLVSLLQDARRDVEPAIAEAMMARYLRGACIDDEAAFARAYAILGAQRNAKILGIFIRLARRDGKTGYLPHVPRVERLFAANLAHPALAPVRDWALRHAPALARLADGGA